MLGVQELSKNNFYLNFIKNMTHTLNGKVAAQLIEDEHRNQDLSTRLDSPNSNNKKLSKRDDWSDATKELLDILPQVWTRGMLYFMAVFVAIALPWAMFSQVEETGKARGRLEPQGKTVQLDAPVAGTVAQIQVKEGETIKAGQKILELESELISAELQQQSEGRRRALEEGLVRCYSGRADHQPRGRVRHAPCLSTPGGARFCARQPPGRRGRLGESIAGNPCASGIRQRVRSG